MIRWNFWGGLLISALSVLSASAGSNERSPADGETLPASTLDQFCWRGVQDAGSYNIYLGETSSLVSSDLLGSSSTNLLVYDGKLAHGDRYFWRVDAVLPGGVIVSGETSSFSVSYPLVANVLLRNRSTQLATIAIGDEICVIGEPRISGGVVQVIERRSGTDTWVRETILEHPAYSTTAQFGESVAVHGERFAVGAPADGDGRGYVYVFAKRNGTWAPIKTIVVPGDLVGEFGTQVYLDDRHLIVGAPGTDQANPTGGSPVRNSGSVFIFQIDTWELVQELRLPVPGFNHRFGRTIAADENALVIGPAGGPARVFERDPADESWSFTQTLEFPSGGGDISSRYGESIATDGNSIAISDPGLSFGKVYLYQRDGQSGWDSAPVEIVKPGPPVSRLSDGFGIDLAFANNRLFCGSFDRSTIGLDTITAFDGRRNWEPGQTISSDGRFTNFFAASEDYLATVVNYISPTTTEFYRIGDTATSPPVFTSTPYAEAAVGTEFAYSITATSDNPNDNISISAVDIPSWLTLTPGASTGSAKLEGTPPAEAAGTVRVGLRASSASGQSVTQSFDLTVFADAVLPAISQIRGATDVYLRQNIALAADVIGTGTIRYQWYFNGSPIEGATSYRLRIDPVGNADAGSYILEVSNSAGSTTSAPINLSVANDERIGGDWTTYGGRSGRRGYYPATLRDHRFVPNWTADILPGSELNHLCFGEGNVYVTARTRIGNSLPAQAINLATGELRWTYDIAAADSLNPPTYHDGRVFIQGGNTDMTAFLTARKADKGDEIWLSGYGVMPGLPLAPAVNDTGIFINRGSAGTLYGLRHDGSTLFSRSTQEFDGWTPTLSRDGRLFSWVGGEFAEHDTANGAWHWSSRWQNVAQPPGGGITAIEGSRAVVISSTHIQSHDIDTRSLVWAREQVLHGSPSIDRGTVYASDLTKTYAFTLSDGSPLGEFLPESGATLLPNQPLILDDVVITSSAEKTFIFDRDDHDLIQTIPHGGYAAYTDGFLAIAGLDGVLRTYSANRSPHFLADQVAPSVNEDQPYSAQLRFEDDDNEILTVEPFGFPEFLTLTQNDNSEATISGTPLVEHVGTHEFSVKLSDSAGLSTTQTWSLQVVFVDDLPTSIGIPTKTVAEDSGSHTIDLRAFFDDEESGPAGLGFSFVNEPGGTITSPVIEDGTFSFGVSPDAFGEDFLLIRATDSGGQSVEAELVIIVTPVDDQPRAQPIEAVSASATGASSTLSITGYFSDPDPGDTLRFSIGTITNPALFDSVTVDPESGQLSINYAPYFSGGATIAIRATDSSGLYVDLPLTVIVPAIPQPTVEAHGPMRLNPQTGLYEHRYLVINNGQRAIGGFQLSISGLAEGSSVYNSSAQLESGRWQVIHASPIPPGGTVELVLEYYVPDRSADFTPIVEGEHMLPPSAAPVQLGAKIDRIETTSSGQLLLEFPSKPGVCYQVQYSADNQTWHDSLARLRAGGTRVQWIDSGAPRTPTHPSATGLRFYRVLEKQDQ